MEILNGNIEWNDATKLAQGPVAPSCDVELVIRCRRLHASQAPPPLLYQAVPMIRYEFELRFLGNNVTLQAVLSHTVAFKAFQVVLALRLGAGLRPLSSATASRRGV